MNTIKTIALSALSTVAFAAVVNAAEPPSELTMKPLQGIGFEIGAEHAVSYFLNENGKCKLVMTLGAAIDWDRPAEFSATRFEAAIHQGATSRYTSSNGHAIEFSCKAGAVAMGVRTVQQFAADESQ